MAVASPSDLVNLALANIGYKQRVADLFDGSDAAKVALQVYGQTRDALLRQSNWGFAEKVLAGTTAARPANSPFAYAYAYPTDCLKLRSVFDRSYLLDQSNPLPIWWNISEAAGVKLILCTSSAAVLTYTAKITDPTLYEPLFVEALVVELSRGLAPILGTEMGLKVNGDLEKGILPLAEDTLG